MTTTPITEGRRMLTEVVDRMIAAGGEVVTCQPAKSYGQADRIPTGAYAGAARYVEREYGDGYLIGYAGLTDPVNGTNVYVFQCSASDGSRFLVWSDKWENAGNFAPALEAEVAWALQVEVTAP